MINEHLNEETDIEKVANNIFKTIGILNRLKYLLPLNIKITLYNSLILSNFNHCIFVCVYEFNRINHQKLNN